MKPSPPVPAKLSAPRMPRVLARTRLFRRLDQARRHPIVWLTGPPGIGKTTLVASYLPARHLRSLWYQVDEGDGDIATFFHYLGLAGQHCQASAKFPQLWVIENSRPWFRLSVTFLRLAPSRL